MLGRPTALLTALTAALALGCAPEDRDPVLIGGDGGADADTDGGIDEPGECTGEDYPCGPYGHARCDTMPDHRFIAANDAARELAGDDGLLDMHEMFDDGETTAILLYGTAGWCSACVTESRSLNALYAEYQEIPGTDKRAEFIAVVFQDNAGAPATAEFAEAYADQYAFEFPTVADTSGDILYYFDAASTPGNIFVDASTMQIFDVVQGFDEGSMRARLGELDGTATCRR
jgi:thiol-disulfide isomerase/thioredoxin